MRAIAVLLLSMLALIGCGESGPQTQQWRFALEEIEGSVQHAYAMKFKELVEQRSGGEVEVLVYPYGSLGTSAQLTEQVQNGTLQFAFASPGHLGSVVPEAGALTLHFLFSDDETLNQRILADSPTLHGPLAEAYQDHGLKLLDLVQEGWMVWTGDRALRTPADFQGFKIRTMVSPLLLETYRAYGANPTPMPYAEVYSGLQLNTIDGQVNPVFAIEEMSFYEVQDVMTFANHVPFIASVVTSPTFYQGLSAEQQQMLDAVTDELGPYIFEVQRKLNQERLQKIRANSDIETVSLTEDERAAFREASMPARDVYRAQAGERGAQILDGLIREVAEAERGG
jgi:tripartite ATP-independent transporter DctP family solute receptor